MKKVLLIEDDLQLVRMYQLAFEISRVIFLSALDGSEAISKIKSKKPDLILLDLIIPKKSGFLVLEIVKKDPEFKYIPVFCLSVLHQQTEIDRCKALGAEEFFVKTDVYPDDVVNRVVARLNE